MKNDKPPFKFNADDFAPVVDVPPLQNHHQLRGFDRFVLDNLVPGRWFVRKCFPFEMPDHAFEKFSNYGGDMFVFVIKEKPGMIVKAFCTGCFEDYRSHRNAIVTHHSMGVEFYEPTPSSSTLN